MKTTPLRFYLAARYSRRKQLCAYKHDLEERGHAVPARWLLGEHQVHGVEAARAVEGGGPVPAAQAQLFAKDDVEDIRFFHAVPEVDAAFDAWEEFVRAFDVLPSVHGWDNVGEVRCDDHPLHAWTNWHRAVYPRPFTGRHASRMAA